MSNSNWFITYLYVLNYFYETVQIIKDNRVVIDQLVDILIEKETISGEEFRNIVAEYTPLPEKTVYQSQL